MDTDEPELMKNNDPNRCRWCHILLTPNNLLQDSVCVGCYHYFVSAGIRDEEIFGSPESTPQSDNSPPSKE